MPLIISVLSEKWLMWIDEHGNCFISICVTLIVIAFIMEMYLKYKNGKI